MTTSASAKSAVKKRKPPTLPIIPKLQRRKRQVPLHLFPARLGVRLYRKSKGYSADRVMTMLFCPNGTGTLCASDPTGNAGAVGEDGTYKVAGKTLTLKNGQGGQPPESFTITWLDAKTVELSDGSDIIWRLFDGVKSDCR